MGELTAFRGQVALAARAVTMRSATTYAWFGQAGTAPLARTLYESFYVYGRPVPRYQTIDPRPGPDQAFVAALVKAAHGHGGYEPGWTVLARHGDVVLVEREGLRVRASRADCSSPESDLVALRRHDGARTAMPGFFATYGDAPESSGIEVRLYFQLVPDAAPALVAGLTRRLNASGVPFALKVLDQPAKFDRRDPAVLYLSREAFPSARSAVRATLAQLEGATRDRPPPFTQPLARGVAVAEHDRGSGFSFGTSRCRLVAEGLVAAFDGQITDLSGRVEAVAQRFTASGFDLDRPYLVPGSTDEYVL